MERVIVNVATGAYVRGQKRLRGIVDGMLECWTNSMPPGSPSHSETPYAFKAYALEEMRRRGFDLVMWADASVKPIASMEPIWQHIEKRGYWFASNWWPNGEWCSDAALPLLGITREESFNQMHIAATAFGLNLRHPDGDAFLDEYLRLAMNGSFRGPWHNGGGIASSDSRVRGHRHDQTAASVILYKRGMEITEIPKWLAYKGNETGDTILLVDGEY